MLQTRPFRVAARLPLAWASDDSCHARYRWRIFTLVLEDPATLSNCDCLGSARRMQLVQNRFNMRFHGPDGDIQLHGNALVAASEHHLSKYVSFPVRESSLIHPLAYAPGDHWTQG